MDSIYREIILEHSKHPQNKGTLDPHDFTYEDTNPLCGDEIRIDVRVDSDNKISDIKFSGQGCAISQASASLLTEMVQGMDVDEVKNLPKEELLEEIGIDLSPARLKCALLSLHVLKTGLHSSAHAENGADGNA